MLYYLKTKLYNLINIFLNPKKNACWSSRLTSRWALL